MFVYACAVCNVCCGVYRICLWSISNICSFSWCREREHSNVFASANGFDGSFSPIFVAIAVSTNAKPCAVRTVPYHTPYHEYMYENLLVSLHLHTQENIHIILILHIYLYEHVKRIYVGHPLGWEMWASSVKGAIVLKTHIATTEDWRLSPAYTYIHVLCRCELMTARGNCDDGRWCRCRW